MAEITALNKQLKANAEKFRNQLSKIKVCVFDIDGILTDGRLRYEGEEIGFNRTYHIQDGYGIKILMEAGVKVGVISGGDNVSVRKRFVETLKLDFSFFGKEDKRESYKEVLAMGYKDEEILFMGDEFIDLPIMRRVGFGATVPNSSIEIQEAAAYITMREGGEGAVREVIDMLRFVQNLKVKTWEF